jgi:uncharacterized membrane protein YidH (DUF202 family)
VVVDVALLVLGILALGYCLLQPRQTDPAPRRGTALQRTRTLYLVGVAAACLMIAGSLANLLGT